MKHFLSLFACLLMVCSLGYAQEPNVQGRVRILVETNKGKLLLELFDETPIHRDAFVRNVKAGVYDGVLFHRVIRDFMIQGGNPLTKGLKPDEEIREDESSLEHTLPAEIRPELFVHTRGVLAAARQADEENPEQRSSANQFYIVTGKYLTDFDLDEEEAKKGFKYTAEQRATYKFQGGAPHLDGAYTVFGRLIDGWKVVDKIQRVLTSEEDRPLKNVVIKHMQVLP